MSESELSRLRDFEGNFAFIQNLIHFYNEARIIGALREYRAKLAQAIKEGRRDRGPRFHGSFVGWPMANGR